MRTYFAMTTIFCGLRFAWALISVSIQFTSKPPLPYTVIRRTFHILIFLQVVQCHHSQLDTIIVFIFCEIWHTDIYSLPLASTAFMRQILNHSKVLAVFWLSLINPWPWAYFFAMKYSLVELKLWSCKLFMTLKNQRYRKEVHTFPTFDFTREYPRPGAFCTTFVNLTSKKTVLSLINWLNWEESRSQFMFVHRIPIFGVNL